MQIYNKDLVGYVFCDFETTGVSDNDLPIEVGIIFCDKKLNILEEYESFIWFNGLYDENWEKSGAFKVHKIKFKTLLKEGKWFNKVGEDIIEIIHNLYGDKKPVLCSDCLNFEWQHMRKIIPENKWPFHYCGRDLNVLTDFFGKELKITAHRALADAQVMRKNLLHILKKEASNDSKSD